MNAALVKQVSYEVCVYLFGSFSGLFLFPHQRGRTCFPLERPEYGYRGAPWVSIDRIQPFNLLTGTQPLDHQVCNSGRLCLHSYFSVLATCEASFQ